MDKLAGKHREYAEAHKDFIPRVRHCFKEDKSHTNSDMSDSDGEKEVKRSAHEGQGKVKRQCTPGGDTDCQRRSPSRSAAIERNPFTEKNRKPRHHYWLKRQTT